MGGCAGWEENNKTAREMNRSEGPGFHYPLGRLGFDDGSKGREKVD